LKIKRMAWCMIFAICTVSLPRSEYAKIKTGEEEITCMEQDADIVMFLYRDEYYNEASEKWELENGPLCPASA